jgi:DAHP synthase ferredoxin-like domain
MLIVMKASATASEIDAVVNVIQAIGFRAHAMPGPRERQSASRAIKVQSMTGVSKICPVSWK